MKVQKALAPLAFEQRLENVMTAKEAQDVGASGISATDPQAGFGMHLFGGSDLLAPVVFYWHTFAGADGHSVGQLSHAHKVVVPEYITISS